MTRTHAFKITFIAILVLFGLACKAISIASPFSTSTPSITPSPTQVSPPPEGWIAFVNKNNVWLIHPDGSGLKQITTNPIPTENSYGNDINIKWSPDGQKLAFSQDNRIYLLDAATFITTLLVDDSSGGFDWSLTGTKIIYDTSTTKSDPWTNHGLWTINLETGKKRQVVPPSNYFSPDLSSEDSHVLAEFAAWEPAGYGIIDLATGNSVQVPQNVMGGGGMGNCEWAPTELIVACATFTDETPRKTELRLIDVNGQIQKRLVLPEELGVPRVKWAPDGQRLAMVYHTGDLGGSNQKSTFAWHTKILSLTTDQFGTYSDGWTSDWSPDGRWIVVTWPDTSDSILMMVVNSNSGEATPLTEGLYPTWQPSKDVTEAVPVPSSQENSGQATASSSPQLLCTDVYITANHTPNGDYLQICANTQKYEIGPVEKGAYAVGPNKKFFVYATNSGNVYAARIGDTKLTLIGNVKDFSIIRRGEAPQYEFEFLGDNPYTVQIRDLILKQNKTLPVPHYITASN